MNLAAERVRIRRFAAIGGSWKRISGTREGRAGATGGMSARALSAGSTGSKLPVAPERTAADSVGLR